jgi:tRNA threonylcarbamoyladenosine biosynthesis protein TsaB
VRHQLVSAGASQYVLPWIRELLHEAGIELNELDAIAINIGPGAFTGVRLGIAIVQGLAIASKLPIIAIPSLDALANQLIHDAHFVAACASNFVIAIDARMDEIYWAKYQYSPLGQATRDGEIHLSAPEQVNLTNIDYIAGNALAEFGDRIFTQQSTKFSKERLNTAITLHALDILECAQAKWLNGLQQDVHLLEPLYIRNRVAFTTQERSEKKHI